MKMCMECWEFQPIARECLKKGITLDPTTQACELFKSVTDNMSDEK